MEEEFYKATIITLIVLVLGILIIMIIFIVASAMLYKAIAKPIKKATKYLDDFKDEYEQIKGGFEEGIDKLKSSYEEHKPEIDQLIKEVPLMIEDGIQELQSKLDTYRRTRLQSLVNSQTSTHTRLM